MKVEDDTPEPGEIVRPYPKLPPIRHILNGERLVGGRLIAFEGPDGAGKSTQIAMLNARLERAGSNVVVAGMAQNLLTGHTLLKSRWENSDPYTMALIYTAGLTDTVNRLVLPALEAGSVVLMDRYIYSIMARSTVRGCQRAWVEMVVSHLPIPDLVVQLQIPVHVSLARKQSKPPGPGYWESGADVYGDDSLRSSAVLDAYAHSFVRYQHAMQRELAALLADVATLAIDADRDADAVHQTISNTITAPHGTPCLP